MLSYFSCVWLFATLWTVARQALCPWWFSRWEYWSGLWGDIPDPGIKFTSGLVLLFSHSVMSDSLRPHGLQHARLPCPSLSSGVCNLVLYSPGLHFHHQTHPQLSIISALAQLRFFLDLLAIVLHFSPVAYWTPSNLGGSSSGVISLCLFMLFMGFSHQEY